VPTVGSIQAADVLIALDALGADAVALRDEAGITRQMLEDPAGRVPASAAVRIFELAAEALNDPLAGLNVGLKLRPRGPLFFLLLAGPDTRHAIRAYARFAKLALDTIEVASSSAPTMPSSPSTRWSRRCARATTCSTTA
jgi:hypothetical protein